MGDLNHSPRETKRSYRFTSAPQSPRTITSRALYRIYEQFIPKEFGDCLLNEFRVKALSRNYPRECKKLRL
jgi:hypothetical protein